MGRDIVVRMFRVYCNEFIISQLVYLHVSPPPSSLPLHCLPAHFLTHTTFFSTEERESLNFKLKGTKDYDHLISLGETEATVNNNLGQWGHEFIRSLAGEIGQEYNARVISGCNPDEDAPFADLLSMVDTIVPFNVSHNSEAEAVDLLIEVQRLKKILDLDSIDGGNYRRICLYLIKTADFMSDPDDYTVSCHWFWSYLALFLQMLSISYWNTKFIIPIQC